MNPSVLINFNQLIIKELRAEPNLLIINELVPARYL